MHFQIITDNKPLYKELAGIMRKQAGNPEVTQISSLKATARKSKKGNMGLVFIDADFGEADWKTLAGLVRESSPLAAAVLLADDAGLAAEAYAGHVLGYVTKPADEDRVKEEIANYCDHYARIIREHSGVEVMTKNGFECFIDGVPVRFRRRKAKDVLAYLVKKNGAMVSNSDLIRMLWHDDRRSVSDSVLQSRNSNIRTIKADLVRVFTEAGYPDLIRKNWGEISVDLDRITVID